jgi:hypothetical protein
MNERFAQSMYIFWTANLTSKSHAFHNISLTIPNEEEPNAGSIPIHFFANPFAVLGSYSLPCSCAASISFVWNTFPIPPKYLGLYSLSNDGDLGFLYFLSWIDFVKTISIIQQNTFVYVLFLVGLLHDKSSSSLLFWYLFPCVPTHSISKTGLLLSLCNSSDCSGPDCDCTIFWRSRNVKSYLLICWESF